MSLLERNRILKSTYSQNFRHYQESPLLSVTTLKHVSGLCAASPEPPQDANTPATIVGHSARHRPNSARKCFVSGSGFTPTERSNIACSGPFPIHTSYRVLTLGD